MKVDGKEYQSKNLALRVLSIPVDTVHVDRFYGLKKLWPFLSRGRIGL